MTEPHFRTAQSSIQVLLRLLPLIPESIPPFIRRFMLNFVPSRNVQKLKKIVDGMERTSKKVISAKMGTLQKGDEAVAAQVGRGKDIMSILCAFLVIFFFFPRLTIYSV